MRNGFFALMALAVGGIGYAAVTSGSPSTRPNSGGSCCGMNMDDMPAGMGCKMGSNSPTTNPTASTPAPAAQHPSCCGG